MNTESTPYGSAYLPVDGMDPHLVNARDDGQLCVELNPSVGHFHACLVGTPDELQWLADKLRAIVTAHESSTKLAGDAAREAVNAARIPTFDQWLTVCGWNVARMSQADADRLHPQYLAVMAEVRS